MYGLFNRFEIYLNKKTDEKGTLFRLFHNLFYMQYPIFFKIHVYNYLE